MERVRWLLALPEPGYNSSGKSKGEVRLEAFLRKRRSPLWRFIHWCRDINTNGPRVLRELRDLLWAATLGRWFYIKVDRHSREALSMRFLSSRTKIPLPRVWFTPTWKGTKYIFMSRIHGVDLARAWDNLPDGKKVLVAEQLRNFMLELRSIPPPPGTIISSLDGGPVQSSRLHEWDPTSGPFRDEQHLNLQLRHLRPLETLPELIQVSQAKTHPIVFTHNDFFPRNIMIDEPTGRVLAIIDWESSGWFPSHWEYCISRNWGTWRPEQLEWMEKYVPQILPVFEEEAEADKMLMYGCGFPMMVPTEHAP